MNDYNKIKVMTFGVFDNLHHGHRYLLSEAREHGDELIVVVAPDSSVQQLKLRSPSQPLSDRIKAIKDTKRAHHVVPGDIDHGSWNVITTHEPSIVVFGHDQYALREALETHSKALPFSLKFITIDKLKLQ